MKKQRPARRDTADYPLRWVLASIAGLLFITAYLPKHPVQASRNAVRSWLTRRRKPQASGVSASEA
jgi:mxaL protein